METIVRKPLQGVTNIIRFNWHCYVIAFAFTIALFATKDVIFPGNTLFVPALLIAIIISTIVSLLVSFYVYDLSDLYKFKWLDELRVSPSSKLVNINAGFDETSWFLKGRFPGATLRVADFYDPLKHTEVSIRRARKAYPAYERTESINTSEPFLSESSVDFIFLILAAHEIRNREERQRFFQHLQKGLKENGKIIVVEHLRDLPNFLAYTIGFFHFYSKRQWKETFKRTGLRISDQQNITPFITAFSLSKNGTTS